MRTVRLDRAAAAALAWTLLTAAGAAGAAGAKYYFQVREVKASKDIDPVLKAYAGEAVKADLAARPEWASDVGQQGSAGQDALVAELTKRKLRGFNVTVRLEEVKKEIRPPKPGGRLNQLAVNVRLTVFGTTIPEEKLAFSGDGEAGLEAEVSEKRMEAESLSVTKDAIKDAIKQAVDQSVTKLAVAKSAPQNENRRKRK
jgi:hypothetical protein